MNTNEKARFKWTQHWRAQSCSRERINWSRTEYSIFLKEKAYPNAGNWYMRHILRALEFLRFFVEKKWKVNYTYNCEFMFYILWPCNRNICHCSRTNYTNSCIWNLQSRTKLNCWDTSERMRTLTLKTTYHDKSAPPLPLINVALPPKFPWWNLSPSKQHWMGGGGRKSPSAILSVFPYREIEKYAR